MTDRRSRILGFTLDLVVDRRIVAGWTVFDEFGPLIQIYTKEPPTANCARSQKHAN